MKKLTAKALFLFFGVNVSKCITIEDGFLYLNTDSIDQNIIASWLDFVRIIGVDNENLQSTIGTITGCVVEINNSILGLRIIDENKFIAYITLEFLTKLNSVKTVFN